MSDVAEIERRLREAREAYYNLDPVLSDEDYDALKEHLRVLKPDSPEIVAVGAEPPQLSVWGKVHHEMPMGSLDKVNSSEEFIEWAGKTGADRFLITHKLDGSSLAVTYVDGTLKLAATRGDGRVGEDVTANASQIPTIPKQLKELFPVSIRGEVVMLRNVFREKYAEKYANPRNTANGKLREKKGGGEACRDLTFIAYSVSGRSFETEDEQFEWLNEAGFRVPDHAIGGAEGVCLQHDVIMSERQEIPYDIDGSVIRVNDMKLQKSLGELNMRPRGQIAWKPEAETSVSVMKDVVWQVGPTGRVSPVAIVEPVKIGGVTIERVSLHNLKMFRELNLWRGCRVMISRRNDVIPYVEENLDQS